MQKISMFSQRWLGNLTDVLLLLCLILIGVVLVWGAWHVFKRDRQDVYGTKIGAPLVIFLIVIAVFITGYKAQHALVGDEVTHFYMLTTQADDLSKPNFYAHIPMADGRTEVRRYPHSFLWHYFGAALYHFSGDRFLAVQIYQALFLAQLLIVAYLFAKSRGGDKTRAALLYVMLIASLPVVLLLSVTFYQDVPMSAQALTAFYLLDRRRWLLGSVFLALAVGMKITAILFFPAFFLFLAWRLLKQTSLARAVLIYSYSLVLILGSTWGIGKAINIYGEAAFYPQQKIEAAVYLIAKKYDKYVPWLSQIKEPEKKRKPGAVRKRPQKEKKNVPEVIANHPGDLRIKENYLIYGGIVLWMVVGGFLLSFVFRKRTDEYERISCLHSSTWIWLTGGSYILLTICMVSSAPDARFFLPGLVFVLLPVSERFVKLPKLIPLIILLASLALLQVGYVLAKTYKLRLVTPATIEAISYLGEHKPAPDKIFMYPEGNYRLFPVRHEWYLGYRLKDFWRGTNDQRIDMLHHYGIGAIVIKKHLISSVNDKVINLGVYPADFVRDIQKDPRFNKVYENSGYLIFATPEDSGKTP